MADGQIIVTGASRGIGAQIALELEKRGYPIAGLSRSGHTAAGYGIACDVTDEAGIRHAIAKIAEKGSIAGLVNNAGLHEIAVSAELVTEQFNRIMAVNATSVMIASREVYPHLKANGGGLLVNMGSFFDKLGVTKNLAYCASKAAVGAISRCLAVEWAPDGITVVNIAPGYIETDLNKDFLARDSVRDWLSHRIPVGKAAGPDQVARLIASLFDEKLPFMTGETIYIDGGQGIFH
ncbi:MAG: SDR family oxidoreductase [Burkholderiaceae bacterium]